MAPYLPINCKGGCEFALKTDLIQRGRNEGRLLRRKLSASIGLPPIYRVAQPRTLERCAEQLQTRRDGIMKNSNPEHAKRRRSFLKGSLAAGVAIAGAPILGERKAFAQSSESLTDGDVAILRLLAAAELIEADLWQQYAELGGVTQGTQNQYQL